MVSDSPRTGEPDGVKATVNSATVGRALPGSTPHGRRAEGLMLAVAFVLVNLAGMLFQKQITYNAGKAWEGEFYYDVAEQYTQGKWHVASEAPLVYRIGTPFLASLLHRRLFPGDLFLCFKIVNGVANALTLALLILWLRRFVGDWRIRAALGLMFLLQWDTPTRWLYFYPAHTDPWMWVFLLAGLLAVERYREHPSPGRMLLVAALGAAGIAFREVVLVVPAAFLFVRNPVRGLTARGWFLAWREVPRLAWCDAGPLAAGLAALLAVRLVARQTNDYSFAATAAHFLYDKPWPIYLQSVFLAFGPVVWFPILYWRQARAFLADRQYLAAYLAAFALLGLIGGTDTERLLYWAMPVVYVLIGRALEEQRADLLRPWWLPAGFIVAQLVASRAVFWPIPDHPSPYPNILPVFTPFGRKIPFMELFSYYQSHGVQLASLTAYLAVGALLASWLNWKRTAIAPVPQKPLPA